MDLTKCDRKQIQGLVSERNEYRRLLGKCLYGLNHMPNPKIVVLNATTYDLALAIESAFKRFDK